jgi:TRAP-type C4-dicarboxylate transport system permease small subunit
MGVLFISVHPGGSMKKYLDMLFRAIEALIAVFLAVMIILTFLNVVLRYVFHTGFAWSEEVARLCFIYLVYLGSIEAMRDNRHLMVDSILVRIPGVAQKILYAVLQLTIVVLMYILTEGSWRLVRQNLGNKWAVTHFPIPVVYFSGAVLGVSIALIAVANIVRMVVSKKSVAELLTAHDEVGGDKTVKTQEIG